MAEKEEVKEQKPLSEKEKFAMLKQRQNYKKQLKDTVELLELEVKFLQLRLAKPRLEYELYRMEHPEEFETEGLSTPEPKEKLKTPPKMKVVKAKEEQPIEEKEVEESVK
jgi:hypothetical protein